MKWLLLSLMAVATSCVSETPMQVDTNYHNFYLGHRAGGNNGLHQNAHGLGDYGCATMIGELAGVYATNVLRPTFVGFEAGRDADRADYGVFYGVAAGQMATNAAYSTFVGYSAGRYSPFAYRSVFLGHCSGRWSTNASDSVLLGHWTQATNCHNVILIGSNVSTTNSNETVIGNTNTLNTVLNSRLTLKSKPAPVVTGTDVVLWNSNGTLYAVSATAIKQLLP